MNETNLIVEPGKQEIVLTRTFDAPRELLFKVTSNPDLIPQWWGPAYLSTTVEKMEVRPGGQWRIVQVAPDGSVHGFHGVYHSVEAPFRTVMTFEYEGTPGHVVMQTVTLEERGGQTLLTEHSVFQSVADRDGMVESGMESGAREMMDRLAALAEEQGAQAPR